MSEDDKSTATAVEIEIDQTSEHNFWSGLEMNIEGGGVFVATHQSLDVGTPISVEMSLPFEQEPVMATGEVLWIRAYNESSEAPPGVGVRFVDVRDEDIQKIRRFTERVREPIFFAA